MSKPFKPKPTILAEGDNMNGYNVFVDGHPDRCAYFEKYDDMKAYVKTLKEDGFVYLCSHTIVGVFAVIMIYRGYRCLVCK